MALRPVQQPHPPVWVAANNDRAVERAAEIGDTWVINPHATLATIGRQMGLYRAALERQRQAVPGRAADDARDLRGRESRGGAGAGPPEPGAEVPGLRGLGPAAGAAERRRHDPGVRRLLRDRFILGDPATCADEIQRCVDETGANTMIFRVTWPGMPQEGVLRGLRLLAEQVRPRVTAKPARAIP